jgi:hypothetical protein
MMTEMHLRVGTRLKEVRAKTCQEARRKHDQEKEERRKKKHDILHPSGDVLSSQMEAIDAEIKKISEMRLQADEKKK